MARGARPGRRARRGEQAHPGVLDGIGVLELIHQHVPEALPVVRQEPRVVAPQFECAQQQLREIHHPRAGAGGLVRRVQPDELAAGRVARLLQVLRAPALVLVGVDEPLHLARHPARLIQIGGLEELADETLLILGVEDLKSLREVRLAPVQPQQPVGDAVKGADPQRAARHAQQLLDARAHLARGLVGEGHRQDPVRGGTLGLDHPGDPVRQHAGLAAARPGQHQHRT